MANELSIQQDIYFLFDDFLDKTIIKKTSIFSQQSNIFSKATLDKIQVCFIDNGIGSEKEEKICNFFQSHVLSVFHSHNFGKSG